MRFIFVVVMALLMAVAMVTAQGGNGGKRPSRPGNEPISIGPTFVDVNRPGKQYNDPYLRGGK